jgi:hypothetical protein
MYGGGNEDLTTWAREVLDGAVHEMMERGVVTTMLVEARPVWSLPFEIMIGQVSETHERVTSIWVIAGEVPTDYVGAVAAATPREAARYFALKWQLDAARYLDPSVQDSLGADQKASWDHIGERLARKAEALFNLVEDESMWQEFSSS